MRKFEEDGKIIYVLENGEKHVICSEKAISTKSDTISMFAFMSCIAEKIVELNRKKNINERLTEMLLKEAVEAGIRTAKEEKKEEAPDLADEIKSILDDFFGKTEEN